MTSAAAAVSDRPRPAVPLTKDRVPAEFIGKARTLRALLSSADSTYDKLFEVIFARFRPRPGFIPMPRHAFLARVPGVYRDTMPRTGRLRLTATWTNKELRITELRARGNTITALDWDDFELAVEIAIHAIVIAPTAKPPGSGFREVHQTVAGLGLHALARRYQRGADQNDTAVVRDLAALGTACAPALAKGGEFRIPVADGGVWVGSKVESYLLVRTYIGPEMRS